MEPERRVSSRRVYDGNVVSLRVDEVIAADGHRSSREVIEHGGAVGIVCVHEGYVWLVRQYRYAPQEFLLEIPAGTLHAGEDPAACAERELVEEVGLRPKRLEHLVTYFTTPGITNEQMHLYYTCDVEPAPGETDPGEVIEVERRALTSLRELISSGEITDAKSLVGLSMLAMRTS